ncbi:MAG: hypothetical protein K2M55_03275 [Muribaculaceae bacterium]|nr:hypothetical protein [Muribaculaceae bacterium]
MYIFRSLTLCLLAVLFTATVRAQDVPRLTPTIEHLLACVDSTLAESPRMCAVKEDVIRHMYRNYTDATGAEHRFWRARDLYHEYSTYNSDSAMKYAIVCMALADTLGRPDWRAEMQLNRSYLFSATGLLDSAAAALDSIDPSRLSPKQQLDYCERRLFLGTHRQQYLALEGDEPYTADIDSILVHVLEVVTPDDPDYPWFLGWQHSRSKETALEVIPVVKSIVDSSTVNNRASAKNAWVLSRLYEYAGDPESRLEYLLRSAMMDIRMSNKEIASLEEAADILVQMGCVDHARRYYEYCLRCADDYKSRVRLAQLGVKQERVIGAIHAASVLESRQSKFYILCLVFMLFIAGAAVVFLWRQHRQVTRQGEKLSKANAELETRVAELQQTRVELARTNEELRKACEESRENARELTIINESREQYIASIFGLCSDYISKLDGFRKNIYHMLVARRFDDVSKLTKSADLPQSELKELYANFDSIFLSIYPNFVEDFNGLLRPEERIVPRRPDSLNTELRIYALVRLGLNDSVKIAQFLHCSVQTVYNTRLRTRNKSIIPKDEFAATVARLGKLRF